MPEFHGIAGGNAVAQPMQEWPIEQLTLSVSESGRSFHASGSRHEVLRLYTEWLARANEGKKD